MRLKTCYCTVTDWTYSSFELNLNAFDSRIQIKDIASRKMSFYVGINSYLLKLITIQSQQPGNILKSFRPFEIVRKDRITLIMGVRLDRLEQIIFKILRKSHYMTWRSIELIQMLVEPLVFLAKDKC